MALTVGAVDAIRARLAAIPHKDESAREVTRLEALARMRGEILGLREGGHSWEEVAEIISREGCRVTAATLRTELSRGAAASKGKKPGSRASGRGARPRGQPREASGRVESKVVVANAPAQPQPVSDVPVGTFVVREDSDI
jgi:hypothetical protein